MINLKLIDWFGVDWIYHSVFDPPLIMVYVCEIMAVHNFETINYQNVINQCSASDAKDLKWLIGLKMQIIYSFRVRIALVLKIMMMRDDNHYKKHFSYINSTACPNFILWTNIFFCNNFAFDAFENAIKQFSYGHKKNSFACNIVLLVLHITCAL